MNISQLILEADIVVKLILIVLLIASTLSWWIFIYKNSIFNKSIKKSNIFYNKVSETKDLDDNYEDAGSLYYKDTYLAAIFKAGFLEIKDLVNKNIDISSLDNVKRALSSEKENELFKMQKNISILATISSSSPFIGLFGTVWGVMNSFIGLSSNTSLNTLNAVAPGIAEALITTALGIFTAIPALIFYNHFNNLVEKIENNSNNFISFFINLIYREFIQTK